jgi:hypothetical protein
VPTGQCSPNGDYCVIAGTGLNGPVRIRVGAVPFMQLHNGQDFTHSTPPEALYTYTDTNPLNRPSQPFTIGGGDTLDGYGNRLVYAVSENQATSGFLQSNGGIFIEDENHHTINATADYILISTGKNALGAHDYNGNLQSGACNTGAGADTENCKDATTVGGANASHFLDSLYNFAPGPGYFDDVVLYRPWMPYFLWQVTPSNANNINNLNTGNVGLGLVGSIPGKGPDPATEKLDLRGGNLVLSGAGGVTGGLYTNQLCDNATTPNCFDPALIGGPDPNVYGGTGGLPVIPSGVTVPQQGTCPVGQVIVGIANNQATCGVALGPSGSGSCGGKFAIGFQYTTTTKTIVMLCQP